METFSKYPQEKELLLPPNTRFVVRGAASDSIKRLLGVADTVHVLVLEELEPEEAAARTLLTKAWLLKELRSKEAKRESWAIRKEVTRQFPDTAAGLCIQATLLRQKRLRPLAATRPCTQV